MIFFWMLEHRTQALGIILVAFFLILFSVERFIQKSLSPRELKFREVVRRVPMVWGALYVWPVIFDAAISFTEKPGPDQFSALIIPLIGHGVIFVVTLAIITGISFLISSTLYRKI